MLYFLIGIIVGILLTALVLFTVIFFRTTIERTLRQVESKGKPEGVILEDSGDLDAILNSLKHE